MTVTEQFHADTATSFPIISADSHITTMTTTSSRLGIPYLKHIF